jgi:hypothetical protein
VTMRFQWIASGRSDSSPMLLKMFSPLAEPNPIRMPQMVRSSGS